MAELVEDCPRCDAKQITFDVLSDLRLRGWGPGAFEVFCACRACCESTVFVVNALNEGARKLLSDKGPSELGPYAIGQFVGVLHAVTIAQVKAGQLPQFLPDDIHTAFVEGARCLAIGCHNAAGTMFRLCVDLSTVARLPAPDEPDPPNARVRRDLGLRLPWLFEKGRLPGDLRDLADCIKEDGNDGAHRGTLTREEAEDLLDFSAALLERLYTEPERVRQAAQRRVERRAAPGTA